MKKAGQSIHPRLAGRQACKSAIQTILDVVKAHGGEFKVESKDGIGANFNVILSY
jgi:hypothetical protein